MDNITDEKQKIINGIMLINCGEDEETIVNIFKETDTEILKYITSITVHDQEYIPMEISGGTNSWGTTTSWSNHRRLKESKIDIVASKFRIEYPENTFEHTLKHEIGHVKGRMISPEIGDSEKFANNYAADPKNCNLSLLDKLNIKIWNVLL